MDSLIDYSPLCISTPGGLLSNFGHYAERHTPWIHLDSLTYETPLALGFMDYLVQVTCTTNNTFEVQKALDL